MHSSLSSAVSGWQKSCHVTYDRLASRHCLAQRRCRCSAAAQPECLAQLSSQYNPAISVWSIPDQQQFPPEVRNAVILQLDESGESGTAWVDCS